MLSESHKYHSLLHVQYGGVQRNHVQDGLLLSYACLIAILHNQCFVFHLDLTISHHNSACGAKLGTNMWLLLFHSLVWSNFVEI